MKPIDFLHQGHRCHFCNGGLKKEHEQFCKEVFDLEGNNYLVLDNYINSKTQISMKHNVECCNHEFNIAPAEFLEGHRCPICTQERIRIEKEKRVFSIMTTKGMIPQPGERYIDNRTPIKYECILHKNKVQQITPSKINLGRGCRLCAVEKNSGSTHYNWQGGISNLNLHLRSLLRSLIDDKLKEYNYECFITNINGTLEVHHLYNFNKIVQDVLNELNLEVRENVEDYTLDEIKKINKLFIEKHTDNWGIPILPEIHDLFHYFYGLKNNTPEQFYEFIKRFDKHEFDSYLNIKN